MMVTRIAAIGARVVYEKQGKSPLPGVPVPADAKEAVKPTIDGPRAACDDASIPAMAPVGDVMPRNLSAACDLRAAFAHHKGNRHG